MEKNGISNAGGPIGRMLKEHTQGRAYIAAMADAVAVAPIDSKAFTSSASAYVALMRDHIAKGKPSSSRSATAPSLPTSRRSFWRLSGSTRNR